MHWLTRIRRGVFQLIAGTLVLLAVLVGVARLALLEAPRLAGDVRRGVFDATGFDLSFTELTAGVSVHGPELRLSDVGVGWPDGTAVAAAGEVAVALDVWAALSRGKLRPSRLYLADSAFDIRISEDGQILVQGVSLQQYLPADTGSRAVPDIRLAIENVAVTFADSRRSGEVFAARIDDAEATVADGLVEARLDLVPEATLGRRLEVAGRVPLELLRDPQNYRGKERWQLQGRAQDFRLDPWLRLVDVRDAPIIGSDGTAEAAVEFVGREPVSALAELNVENVILTQPAEQPVSFDRISGEVAWSRDAQGWRASGEQVVIERGGDAWPAGAVSLDYRGDAGPGAQLAADIEFMRLQDLLPVARTFAADQLRDAGVTGQLAGDLSAVKLTLALRDGQPGDYAIAADFKDLAYISEADALSLTGFSGSVSATRDGGQLSLRAKQAEVFLGKLFRERWPLTSVNGLAVWRANADGYRLIANDLDIATPEGRGRASLELQTDLQFTSPVIDLTATASMDDTNQAIRYLPRVIPDQVVDWLRDGLRGGRAPAADFRLRGPLREFPFRQDEGEFRIEVEFADGALDYAPGWPGVDAASGHLVFENESLYSTDNDFMLGRQRVRDVSLMIADLRQGVVELEGGGAVELESVLHFVQNSPLAGQLGPVLAELRATGPAAASAVVVLPVRDLDAWTLTGELDLQGGSVWLTGLEPRFTELDGTVRIRNRFLSSDDLAAQLLDESVDIRIRPDTTSEAEWSHRAVVTGQMPYLKLEAASGLPRLSKLSGRAAVTAVALFPAYRPDAAPFKLQLSSDLVGIVSNLPEPLGKRSVEAEALSAEVRFPERNHADLTVKLERGLLAQLEFASRDDRWRFERGAAGLNTPPPVYKGAGGLVVSGVVEQLDLGAWTAAFAEPNVAAGAAPAASGGRTRWQDYFDRMDLDIGELTALGYRFPDVVLGAGFMANAWEVDLAGPSLSGRLQVPYDFVASERIDFDMRRLLLVDGVRSPAVKGDENPYSPLDLPAIRGTADEFALGTLRFGSLEADIERTPRGLQSRVLVTRSPSFSVQVAGDWLVIDNAQRSRLRVEMNSTDMEQTLRTLGYSPLVDAEEGRLVADLLWEGGPGEGLLYASTGTVDFSITDGEVKDIDPGTGRILGLLSITSLPRRLALDFSDMTDEGLVFDSLRGRFRIDFGDAWTCNLSLEGEVADMAIVGRTGIRREDYEQVAVVRPHVSNLIPVSAAFLGGPTVGIATLLVAQVFKKPLSGIGESYYTVSGDWSSPDIRKAQRSELDTTAFGDCESQLPTLSPEEVAALEDLINTTNQNAPPADGAPNPADTESQ